MPDETCMNAPALGSEDVASDIMFEDLFDVDEMQHLQDSLAVAAGVGSLIIRPDGTPITRPSNFCRVCELARNSPGGFASCRESDAVLGTHDPTGPVLRQCQSAGLWGAGASISVGGQHVASWLIGQVRIEGTEDSACIDYAHRIGIDADEYAAALADVQTMPLERFERIATTVFLFASQLSQVAYDSRRRTHAQRALEERERWLTQSQRIARIGHYTHRIDIDRWDGSDMLYELMGVDDTHRRDTAQWLAIIHPDDRDRMVSYFTEYVVAQRNRFDTEYRIVRPSDGAERWVHGLGDVQYDANGQARAMFGTIQDITDRRQLEDTVQDTLNSVVDVVGHLSETRDPYTAGHQRRVAELAVAIAQRMGLSEPQIADIRMAALVHDVGKISVPAEILSKPSKLSSIEFDLIKRHAEAGYEIISASRMRTVIAEYVYQHHERCDGSGYPRGLHGEELLQGSRVLMVADVVEAIMSHRPYRPAVGVDAALAEIESGAGTRYDEDVVRACLAVFGDGGFAFSQ